MTEDDWTTEYEKTQTENQNKTPKLKLEDGDQKTIEFLDNGQKSEHITYGKSILFKVKESGAELAWYVKTNKFTILDEITRNKPVIGKKARVTRVGKGKTDTRWSIKFV